METIKNRRIFIFGRTLNYFPYFFAADVALTVGVLGFGTYLFVTGF